MTITVFDTSIGSSNLGDLIIMDAVNQQIKDLFGDAMFLRSCTHMKMGRETYKMVLGSDFCFVGGTNLLSSNMLWNWQWRINIIDSLFVNRLILLGVGWWQYQARPSLYTSFLLHRILDKNFMHSVRDSYTEHMLKKIGITNVVNTGCPTLWGLTLDHCEQIPQKKAKNVLFTLTDYKKDLESDSLLIKSLTKAYESVYFWPQGLNDKKYLDSLDRFSEVTEVKMVSPSLKHLDAILADDSISLDYVGTRLHAGIRALQKGRRSIIVGIDNRAQEKSKDFNLTVIRRSDMQKLEEKINSNFKTFVKIPNAKIEDWKNQFK